MVGSKEVPRSRVEQNPGPWVYGDRPVAADSSDRVLVILSSSMGERCRCR